MISFQTKAFAVEAFRLKRAPQPHPGRTTRAPQIPRGVPEPAPERLLADLTRHYTASVNIDAAGGPVTHNCRYPKGSPPSSRKPVRDAQGAPRNRVRGARGAILCRWRDRRDFVPGGESFRGKGAAGPERTDSTQLQSAVKLPRVLKIALKLSLAQSGSGGFKKTVDIEQNRIYRPVPFSGGIYCARGCICPRPCKPGTVPVDLFSATPLVPVRIPAYSDGCQL